MHKPSTLTRTGPWLLLAVGVGVYPAVLRAQSQDFARVIELEGQVSVMRGGPVALFQSVGSTCSQKPPTCVAAAEVIVTGPDGHAIFQIADGSKFEVFPNSQVAFRNTYSFEDLVNVILGKIRVQIEHRNGPNPKRVSTPTAIISVRGTVFDVSVEPNDGATMVSVEEGEVVVQNTRQPGPTRTVDAGDSIWIYPNAPLAKVGGQQPGVQIVFDRILGVARDVFLRIPNGGGGVGFPGSGSPGGVGGQGDKGKKPPAPPPSTPPPPPGGGGQ